MNWELEKPLREYGFEELPDNIRESEEYLSLFEKIFPRNKKIEFESMTADEIAIYRNPPIQVVYITSKPMSDYTNKKRNHFIKL